ncbi:MAG: DUF1569 domain-containing protein [Planctomycetota bacterium]
MQDLPAPTADTPSLAALAERLRVLPADRAPRWGRMNAAQMLRHCRVFCELCLGRVPVAPPVRWLARLLGPWFLRRLLRKPPTQAPKNLGTLPALRARPDRPLDAEAERRALLAALDEIAALQGRHRHPLYGAMRAEDVQTLVRHHTAHHANQFGLLGSN